MKGAIIFVGVMAGAVLGMAALLARAEQQQRRNAEYLRHQFDVITRLGDVYDALSRPLLPPPDPDTPHPIQNTLAALRLTLRENLPPLPDDPVHDASNAEFRALAARFDNTLHQYGDAFAQAAAARRAVRDALILLDSHENIHAESLKAWTDALAQSIRALPADQQPARREALSLLRGIVAGQADIRRYALEAAFPRDALTASEPISESPPDTVPDNASRDTPSAVPVPDATASPDALRAVEALKRRLDEQGRQLDAFPIDRTDLDAKAWASMKKDFHETLAPAYAAIAEAAGADPLPRLRALHAVGLAEQRAVQQHLTRWIERIQEDVHKTGGPRA